MTSSGILNPNQEKLDTKQGFISLSAPLHCSCSIKITRFRGESTTARGTGGLGFRSQAKGQEHTGASTLNLPPRAKHAVDIASLCGITHPGANPVCAHRFPSHHGPGLHHRVGQLADRGGVAFFENRQHC